MNFDIASLSASESRWDRAGIWLAAFVALGVAMEAIDEFDKLAELAKLTTLEGSLYRKKIAHSGLLILIVSLAFEVVAAIESHDISQQIITGLNSEIRETQNREQQLTNQSNTLAAELKYRTTDRTISIEQMVEKLRPFGDVPFAITVSDDPDALQLAGKISEALERAGWVWKENKTSDNSLEFIKRFGNKPAMRIAPAHGIIVNVPTLDGTNLGLAGDALADALKGENLRGVDDQQLSADMMTAEKKIYGVVHLTVGLK